MGGIYLRQEAGWVPAKRMFPCKEAGWVPAKRKMFPCKEAGWVLARPFNCAVDKKCVFRYKKSGRAEMGENRLSNFLRMFILRLSGYHLKHIIDGSKRVWRDYD